MLGTTLYIQDYKTGDLKLIKVDLFKDENLELNSSVQNISDISKTFSDFSQSFTVPASEINNTIFQHYYNTEVDGTFNPHIKIDAMIEVGNLPFRFGIIQLEDVKLTDMQPSSYTIRFFSKVVNLSNLFAEEDLTVLDLSNFDHPYNKAVVFGQTHSENMVIDVYYPLISSVRNFEVGGITPANNITNNSGAIKYTDLKPALRLIRIIDAIEAKYGFTFDREFLGRAVFGNLFMWMHNVADKAQSWGHEQRVDIPTTSDVFVQRGFIIDIVNDTISYTSSVGVTRSVYINILPSGGFESVPYKVRIYSNDVAVLIAEGVGNQAFGYTAPIGNHISKFTLQSTADFTYTTRVGGIRRITSPYSSMYVDVLTPQQNFMGTILIKEVIPKMKVKDFIASLIKMFNLVLIPSGANSFKLLPLDEWYAQGKLVDITDYVDTKTITIKRPKLFKKIEFKHQKSGQALNEQFRLNNGLELGYGDLGTTYDIEGTELKIETQFDNMMFERLQNKTTNNLTNIHVGKSIDKSSAPYIGKPYIFYRNGYQFYEDPIRFLLTNENANLNYTWQTATENDIFSSQVSNSVNFSADISTFSYSTILKNLYKNYWSDYISDLYSTKRRLILVKAQLPIAVIIKIKLNYRLAIGDKAYIINTMKPNLTTGEVNFELLNYIGLPFSSVNENIPLTADTIDYSADTELLTADMNYLYVAQISAIVNGVEYTNLECTSSAQDYDLRIDANAPYSVMKISTGDGVGWVTLENETSDRSGYLLIKVSKYNDAIADDTISRTMILEVAIGDDLFTITITQRQ